MAPDIWGISAIHRPSLSCSISIVKPMTREDRRKQEKLNLVNSPIWPNLIPNALYFARELRNSFLAPGAFLFWKQFLLVGAIDLNRQGACCSHSSVKVIAVSYRPQVRTPDGWVLRRTGGYRKLATRFLFC